MHFLQAKKEVAGWIMKNKEIVFVINSMGTVFRSPHVIHVGAWQRNFCTKNEAKLIK